MFTHRSFQDVTEVIDSEQALDMGESHTTPPPVRFTRLALAFFFIGIFLSDVFAS